MLHCIISFKRLIFKPAAGTIRKSGLLFACICLTLAFPPSALSGKPASSPPYDTLQPYVKGELLIRIKSCTPRTLHRIKDRFGGSFIKRFRHTGTYHIKLPDHMSVEEAVALYANDPDVLRVEPNYLRMATSGNPPDDTFFEDLLWGLNNTGQRISGTFGTVDADINALEAWELTTDCSGVVIAVIDSGIDFHHPELRDNLWTNPDEIPDNGIDDNNNGYVDDIHGWNFISVDDDYTGSSDIMDYNGHGTLVAGIIAARGNNSRGTTGVCWTARIMPLKFININGIGNVAEEITAIEYAMDNGAAIINASFSNYGETTGYSRAERDAIAAAEEAGIIFVAAAGNSGNNNDDLGEANYPASYLLDNIISVTASDPNDTLPAWAGYGPVAVDVAAPGVYIYSIDPGPDTTWECDFESSTAGWTLEGNWGLTGRKSHDGSYSLTDSPGGARYDNQSDTTAVLPSIDLTNRTNPLLTFYIRGSSELKFDLLYVETADDKTGPWTNEPVNIILNNYTLFYEEGISGSDYMLQWAYAVVPLTHLAGQPRGHIRFRFETDISNTEDGWYIDGIQITALDVTYPDPQSQYYGYLVGTSAAVPFVSGLAGLLWSRFPDMTPMQIKDLILSGVDRKPDLSGKIRSGGRINAYNSVLLGLSRTGQSQSPNTETPGGSPLRATGSSDVTLFCFIATAAE